MGRPPSNGAPSFRFNAAEVAQMEAILKRHEGHVPPRDLLVALAQRFSQSPERDGKMVVQMKQVWNWFQNRRYALRAKSVEPSAKPSTSPVTRNDVAPVMNVHSFPQQMATSSGPHVAGNPSEAPVMEFEAKSARDGAWYDVQMFISLKHLDTDTPEVLVRFAGFGPEDDEWVNIVKHVRQRSLPCEASECIVVLPGDLILCFQEGKEQALYFDAHVLDAQRRRHDVRGCRCRFLVRYDHDQSEEIVPLRKICRRPDTDYRLQQLNATNEAPASNSMSVGPATPVVGPTSTSTSGMTNPNPTTPSVSVSPYPVIIAVPAPRPPAPIPSPAPTSFRPPAPSLVGPRAATPFPTSVTTSTPPTSFSTSTLIGPSMSEQKKVESVNPAQTPVSDQNKVENVGPAQISVPGPKMVETVNPAHISVPDPKNAESGNQVSVFGPTMAESADAAKISVPGPKMAESINPVSVPDPKKDESGNPAEISAPVPKMVESVHPGQISVTESAMPTPFLVPGPEVNEAEIVNPNPVPATLPGQSKVETDIPTFAPVPVPETIEVANDNPALVPVPELNKVVSDNPASVPGSTKVEADIPAFAPVPVPETNIAESDNPVPVPAPQANKVASDIPVAAFEPNKVVSDMSMSVPEPDKVDGHTSFSAATEPNKVDTDISVSAPEPNKIEIDIPVSAPEPNEVGSFNIGTSVSEAGAQANATSLDAVNKILEANQADNSMPDTITFTESSISEEQLSGNPSITVRGPEKAEAHHGTETVSAIGGSTESAVTTEEGKQ
ncbi:hypothetical protein vseg_007561 [Gypsophila vaccaria]